MFSPTALRWNHFSSAVRFYSILGVKGYLQNCEKLCTNHSQEAAKSGIALVQLAVCRQTAFHLVMIVEPLTGPWPGFFFSIAEAPAQLEQQWVGKVGHKPSASVHAYSRAQASQLVRDCLRTSFSELAPIFLTSESHCRINSMVLTIARKQAIAGYVQGVWLFILQLVCRRSFARALQQSEGFEVT